MKTPQKYAGLSIGSDNIALVVPSETGDTVTLYKMPLIALKLEGVNYNMFMDKFQATYAKIGASHYILGKDAFNLTGVFPKAKQVRPIVNGLVNFSEPDSVELILAFIKKLMSKVTTQVDHVVFTIPSPSKASPDCTFHRYTLEYVLESMGLKHSAVFDVHASAYTMLAEEDMTGVMIEIGYNLTSICFSYLNVPAVAFSIPLGTKFIEDSVCRDLNLNNRDARKVIEEYDLSDSSRSLSISQTLAVKAALDNFCNLLRSEVVSSLEERKDSLISYEDPVTLALSGGAFKFESIKTSLGELLRECVHSYSLNKIKSIFVSPNPQWSAASGAYLLATSNMQAFTAPEKPISEEILEPLKLFDDSALPASVSEPETEQLMPIPEEVEELAPLSELVEKASIEPPVPEETEKANNT